MKTTNSFPYLYLLHCFFHDWLGRQRNASRHTVLSYRDTWRLFLRFVAKRRQRDVARLALADFTPEEEVVFLDHREKDRGATIATRKLSPGGIAQLLPLPRRSRAACCPAM